ncbi:GDP-mannose 4,6-dehydratase [Reichenbachiella sp.]
MANPSKLLIIGIDSFTGSHLSKYFQTKGWSVFGTSYTSQCETIFQLDIANHKQVESILRKIRPDYIINLAAISFVGEPNRELFYKVNVIGTETLLDAIEHSGVIPKKILMPSSAVVYGKQNDTTLSEKLTPNPINHYGYSKYVGEQICKNYFARLKIVIPRPFNYTGEGQATTFLIPKVVEAFKNGANHIALGNINTFREFNDVTLVCLIYEKLLTIDQHSEIVNVCSGKTHSVSQILNEMELIAGRSIKVVVDGRFVRKNEIYELKGNPLKLESMIGKVETLFPLNSLLQRMYNN